MLEGRQDWSPDEQAALRQVVDGTPTSNFLRLLGKASPEGNGLVPLMELGGMHLDPHAVALPIMGFAAKRLADAATARAVAGAGALMRSGGDAAAMQQTPNALMRAGAALPTPVQSLSLGSLYTPGEAR